MKAPAKPKRMFMGVEKMGGLAGSQRHQGGIQRRGQNIRRHIDGSLRGGGGDVVFSKVGGKSFVGVDSAAAAGSVGDSTILLAASSAFLPPSFISLLIPYQIRGYSVQGYGCCKENILIMVIGKFVSIVSIRQEGRLAVVQFRPDHDSSTHFDADIHSFVVRYARCSSAVVHIFWTVSCIEGISC